MQQAAVDIVSGGNVMDPTSVELIPFRQSGDDGRSLYVTGVPASLPNEEKWEQLHRSFSQYGLVCEVYLPKQNTTGGEGSLTEYAFVKFYSARAAARAQREADRRLCIAGWLLRVQIATQRPGPAHQLSISKCQEMANHYLGFNGWSTRVATVVEVPGGGGYQCTVELEVKGCDGVSVGVGEGMVEPGNQSPVQAIGRAKKQAYHRACVNAFSKVVIVVLPSGKTGAQILCGPDEHMDHSGSLRELMEGCPTVNVLPETPNGSSSD